MPFAWRVKSSVVSTRSAVAPRCIPPSWTFNLGSPSLGRRQYPSQLSRSHPPFEGWEPSPQGPEIELAIATLEEWPRADSADQRGRPPESLLLLLWRLTCARPMRTSLGGGANGGRTYVESHRRGGMPRDVGPCADVHRGAAGLPR